MATERSKLKYGNLSNRYKVATKDYTKQYAHICSQRLTVLRDLLEKKVKKEFKDDVPVCHLFELTVGTSCVLIGTLYKDMDMKPNILKELGDEYGFVVQPVKDRYVSANDRLILEDELQQVELNGNIDAADFVTGAVVACYGKEEESNRGHFIVERIIYPDVDVPPTLSPVTSDDKFILFVSGLEFATTNCAHIPSFHLLCDWLTGNTLLSNKHFGDNLASQVARVVIAGNSLSQSVHDRDYLSKAKYLTKKAAVPTVEPMNALDLQLALLTASINVDVMPGENDPANIFWPQQPLIRAMFPMASHGGGLNMVTNPYAFVADEINFVATSGLNISDLIRFANIDDPIKAMELTLKLRLLAPTAPDTLSCYPLIDKDPFVIDDTPNVYVCGNLSDKVQTKWYYPENDDSKQGVLMMSLPSFAKSKTVALVNVKDLSVREIVMA